MITSYASYNVDGMKATERQGGIGRAKNGESKYEFPYYQQQVADRGGGNSFGWREKASNSPRGPLRLRSAT